MTREIATPTLVELEEQTPTGQRELAAARLELSAVGLLNRACRASGATQKQLSEILGVGESRISQVLNGDGNIRISTFARYLRALGYRATIEIEPVDSSVPPIKPRRSRASKDQLRTELHVVLESVTFNGRSNARIIFSEQLFPDDAIVESRHHMGFVDIKATTVKLHPWREVSDTTWAEIR